MVGCSSSLISTTCCSSSRANLRGLIVAHSGRHEGWRAQAAMNSIMMCHTMSNVMDFSDKKHNLAELAFQGATDMDPEQTCKQQVIDALEIWRGRPDHQSSGAELLHIENCMLFSITYEGEAGEYWPDEAMTDITETLVREFLYRDGICSLTDERVRLIRMKYNVMASEGDEYVLVCPYLTAAGNISGIVVVCVNMMIQ